MIKPPKPLGLKQKNDLELKTEFVDQS